MKHQKLLRISAEYSAYKGWYNVRLDGKFTSKVDKDSIIRMIEQIREKSYFNCLYNSGQWVDFTFQFNNGYSITRKVAFWYFEQDTQTTYYLTFENKGN